MMANEVVDIVEEGLVSREQAAQRLGIGVDELRRRQKEGHIQPAKHGLKGKALYRLADVELLGQNMKRRRKNAPPVVPLPPPPPVYSGEQAAMVFKALSEGKTPVQCVIELKVLPRVADALALEYASMTGALFVSGEVMRAINQLPLDGPMPITKADEVLAVLQNAADPKCVECDKRYPVLCKHCVTAAIRKSLSQKADL